MNKVLLTGRLTRDPEMRALASGKHVTTFAVATNEYVGNGREKAEYHAVIAWDRLADISAQYLGKGSMVAVEGRLQTRQWDDEAGKRHWKTEVVAVLGRDAVGPAEEGLRGRGARRPRPPARTSTTRRGACRGSDPDDADFERVAGDEHESGGSRPTASLPRRQRLRHRPPRRPAAARGRPARAGADRASGQLEERDREDEVDDHEQGPSSQFDSPSRAMRAQIPTAAATAAISSGGRRGPSADPMRAPTRTRTGPTKRATWRLDPYDTAIANSMRSFQASWTATRCSARLPIVGIRMTPTKKADSPNVSMNGSIDADEDLREDRQQRRRPRGARRRRRAGSRRARHARRAARGRPGSPRSS